MTTTPRLLVIGLDGGTFDLLRPLMAQGHMPNLAELVDHGCWGPLASTIPPFTGAAWSTFITGRNPGQHGVIAFTTRDRFNYDTQGQGFVNAQRFDYTLWELLSTAGKRVGVVNVPLTYPARPVNGFMVTGMLTPAGASRFTYPPEFATRIGPDYMIDVDFLRDGERFRLTGLPPKPEMLAQIRRMTQARTAHGVRWLQEEAWEFFMLVYTSTDRVSHFFWDEVPALLAGQPSPNQAELLAFFHELDEGIGQLAAAAGPETNILFMSDHGFGPAPDRRFYVNVWLEQLGLLRPRPGEGLLDLDYWRIRLARNKRLKAALRRILPQSTQDAVQKTTSQAGGQKEAFDWANTQAFFVPIYFHVCGVEVNVQGEHRAGSVPAGAQYEAVRDQIIAAAQQLRDPATGRAIVTLAARREALYDGPYVHDFPDVILVLEPEYIGAGSLAGSSLFEPHPDPMRPGEHREDGIFIASGPRVVPRPGALPNLKLWDVTATILYALDVAIPAGLDGRVLTELFDPAYLAAHPVRIDQAAPMPTAPAAGGALLSDHEEAELAERLRSLGYLE